MAIHISHYFNDKASSDYFGYISEKSLIFAASHFVKLSGNFINV